ncbi:MAG: heme ABC exporter ATP-binding protein CcmA [Alphaproteobacteria bacterium]|nr:heme ABC exporter ATP-binding protein CcmA [Alphaproteobacteria bacterium]
MLSCQNLRAIRGERLLFDHLGFSLKPGAILVLRGANGCGKSTLLRMLAGLMPSAKGDVCWQERNVYNNNDYKELMLYIGHQNAIKPELTVYDNVQYWASMRGSEMLAPAALQFFDLWPMAELSAGQLSAGWQRRVALARLIAIPSLIWLLDEPTANLDSYGVEMLDGLIATRAKQGGIIILASHSKNIPKNAITLDVSEYCGFFSEDLYAD